MVPAGSSHDAAGPSSPESGGGLEAARTTAEERKALLAAFTDEEARGTDIEGGLGLLSSLEDAFPEGGAAIPALSRFVLDGEGLATDESPAPAQASTPTSALPPSPIQDRVDTPFSEAPPPRSVATDEPDDGSSVADLAGLYETLGEALDTLGIGDEHPIREGLPTSSPLDPDTLEDDSWATLEAPDAPETDPTTHWPLAPVGLGRMADDLWLVPGSDARLRLCMPTSLRRSLDPRPPVVTRRGLLLGRVALAGDTHGRRRIDVTILAAVPLADEGDRPPGDHTEARRVMQGLLHTGTHHPGTAMVPVGTYVLRPGGGLVREDGGLHDALMPHLWQTCLVVDDVGAEAVMFRRPSVGRMPRRPGRSEPIFDPATGGLIKGARKPWPRIIARGFTEVLAPVDRRTGVILALLGWLALLWMERPGTFALRREGTDPLLRWEARQEALALYACTRAECRPGDRRRLHMIPAGTDRMALPRPRLGADPPTTRLWYRLAALDPDGQPLHWSRAVAVDWPGTGAFRPIQGTLRLSLDRQTISLGQRRPDPDVHGLWVLREALDPPGPTVLLGGERRLDARRSLQDHVETEGIYRYLILPQDRHGLLGQPWDTAAVGLRARPPWDAWGR